MIFYFFDAYSISFCDGRINWRFFFLLIDLSVQALLNILMNSADGEDGVRFILFLTLFIFGSWCVGFIFCVAVFFYYYSFLHMFTVLCPECLYLLVRVLCFIFYVAVCVCVLYAFIDCLRVICMFVFPSVFSSFSFRKLV